LNRGNWSTAWVILVNKIRKIETYEAKYQKKYFYDK
jgi:hypothetical protein